MSPLYLKDGKLLLVDNALATNQNCCCGTGACCIDYGTQCSDWTVKVSVDGFSDHYTSSSVQCFCSVSGEAWEIQDEWNSLDNTKKIVISGALYYSCIDGQCTFGSGGFSVDLVDIATNNSIGIVFYEANEVGAAINNFPFNITFAVDNVIGQDFSSGISILICAFFSEFINEEADPLLCPAGPTPAAGNNNKFCLDNVSATVCSDLSGVHHPNKTCEENPCECPCSLSEGSVIVVAVDGDDVEFFGPSGPIDASGDFDSVTVCSSVNTFLPDSYCESRLLSSRDVSVYVGCHDADWGDLLPDIAAPLPGGWPDSGMVVVVHKSWASGSIYPECVGGDSGDRFFYYRMSCDGEGYPTTGELFHDSGAVTFDDMPYGCFDCTNEAEINRDCENLSAPSSVSVVVNPLP